MLRGRKRDSISPLRLGSLPKVGRRRTYLAVCRYTPNASCRAQFRTSRCGRYVSPKLASEITSGRNLSSLSICSNSAPSSTTEAKKKKRSAIHLWRQCHENGMKNPASGTFAEMSTLLPMPNATTSGEVGNKKLSATATVRMAMSTVSTFSTAATRQEQIRTSLRRPERRVLAEPVPVQCP